MPEGQSYRKKLIEVALPLEDINRESAREKSIRHGHPSTLHLWWARRPLAACRAVLFAQMVDDPSSLPEEFPTEPAQEAERERLFDIIRELVKWENTTNEAVLHKARVEIARSAARNHNIALWPGMLAPAISPTEVTNALKQYAPPVVDPFAGGGSIPLEAQRLGLEAHASDLNPVAVLINKAMIEIPPKFAGCPPVNPESRKRYLQKEWKGAEGLAEDVRYYGKWMRDEAFKRIGHLYPKARLPKEQGSGEATVIAWLWARTVTCPNPACGAQMPLVRSFSLSTKKGKEAYVHAVVDRSVSPPSLRFELVKTNAESNDATTKRGDAVCLACGTPAEADYVRAEGTSGRMGNVMLSIVAEAHGKRVYLPPNETQERIASEADPAWEPSLALSYNARHMAPPLYGMQNVANLFTRRQLVALTTFSDLVNAVSIKVREDYPEPAPESAHVYADALATYLAFAVDRGADYWSSFAIWAGDFIAHTFGRPALGIVWDYAEANPFSGATGDWDGAIDWIARVISNLPAGVPGMAFQHDATTKLKLTRRGLVSTDPPYYNNVPYADVSDFFYVWLRQSLGTVYPHLFSTLSTPKGEELVADPVRHGNRDNANRFFEGGLAKAFSQMHVSETSEYPVTIYYAFKQSESEDDGTDTGTRVVASSGWDTMLEGLLRAEFSIHGTWPVRTERPGRLRDTGSNALASSIVLVCRPRPADARPATRKDFLNALKRDLPTALKELQRGNIAPVDLAQAAIGPGMAVFSRYSKVIEADGSAMRVRTALQLINQALDEVLAEQEGQFDADTRFAVAWFEQYGMGQGKFGEADVLARAKNTSVGGLDEAGILEARGGNVRLLRRDELPDAWNPRQDHRLSAWKVTQHLIRAVMEGGGAQAAAAVLDAVGSDYGEKARDLAYRLYVTSERKKWTQDAFAYNTLVTEWHDIAGGAEGIRERKLERERATVRQATLIEE